MLAGRAAGRAAPARHRRAVCAGAARWPHAGRLCWRDTRALGGAPRRRGVLARRCVRRRGARAPAPARRPRRPVRRCRAGMRGSQCSGARERPVQAGARAGGPGPARARGVRGPTPCPVHVHGPGDRPSGRRGPRPAPQPQDGRALPAGQRARAAARVCHCRRAWRGCGAVRGADRARAPAGLSLPDGSWARPGPGAGPCAPQRPRRRHGAQARAQALPHGQLERARRGAELRLCRKAAAVLRRVAARAAGG